MLADTTDPTFRRLTDRELDQQLERNQELVKTAAPHLEQVSASLSAVRHIVFLTDKHGIVLRSFGSTSVMNAYGLLPGYDWSEKQMGTNGAGTALAEDQPVSVIGTEHYTRAFHNTLCTGAPIHAPDGSMIGAVDLSTGFEDGSAERLPLVTYLALTIDKELAHRETEQAHRHLEQVVEATRDAITSATPDGVITTWNRGAETLFGYTNQEIVGQHVSLLVPEDRRAEIRAVREQLEESDSGEVFETKRLCKDGTVKEVMLRVSPMHDSADKLAGATAIALDLTERKATGQKFYQRDQQLAHVARVELLAAIASGLGHELNQPLAAIQTYAEGAQAWLSRSPDESQQIDLALQKVTQQVERAGHVIRRLRQFARCDDINAQQISPNTLAGESTQYILPDLQQQKIELIQDLSPGLSPVMVEVAQIEQVLMDLIRNAAEAIDRGRCEHRCIWLTTDQPEPSQIQFTVRDTGPGVHDDQLGLMFHPFFTTKTTGTGMGLNICEAIVHRHRGQVWAEPHKGGGLSCHVRLPVAADMDPASGDDG